MIHLDTAIRAVCPIVGVSVGDWSDKSKWKIDYQSSATQEQKVAAAAILASWIDDQNYGTRQDQRRQRYSQEADHLLIAAIGYQMEMELEPDASRKAALMAKKNLAQQEYADIKRAIRQELPDL